MRVVRTFAVGAAVVAVCSLVGPVRDTVSQTLLAQGRRAAAAAAPVAAPAAGQVPKFEVDPLWPQPFPLEKAWQLGSVNGVTVDAQDHIWLVHAGFDSLQGNERGPVNDPPTSTCCGPAPQILEYDVAGKLLASFGGAGQGFNWPGTPGGIVADGKGNVIIGGIRAGHVDGRPDPFRPAGRGGAAAPPLPNQDAQVLTFSATGSFVRQLGKPGSVEGPEGKATVSRPAGFAVDAAANELYIADTGNRRVLVVDLATGAYKRHWGAFGEKPSDVELPMYDPNGASARTFRSVSCVEIAKDGMVYVCDRQNDRIQVFSKDGKFVKEGVVSKATLGDGSVWDVALSADPQQTFLYVADGQDKKVWVLRRDTLEVVSSFGQGGRLPGTFYGVGSVATDSRGNVYTGETFEGKRIQKWVFKGYGPAAQ